MNNNKNRSTQWAILPILFCSAAVLAGDGGLEAPYGQLPEETLQPAMTAEQPPADVPDTMQQAQDLGAESDGFLDDATQTSSINTGYVGGRTRLGIGIDSEFKGKADLSHVFSESEDSAIIGQGYVGVNPKADKEKGEETLTGAGAKLNYHWVSKDEGGQISHVNKVFGAYDQNEQKDKKVTVGYGQENENLFWSGSVSKGLSDKREVSQGIYEKAYDWGVGGRVGTYLPDQQMRVQGGLDYEWGKDQADTESKPKQVTLTGGVEKFFPDSPHSINANIDVYKKSGGYEEGDQKAEVRGGVGYRYDIASDAGIWQADKMYRRVRTEIPGEEVKQPPKIERKLVKHTMELEADTFFKVDSAKLTPEAKTRLGTVVSQMRECGPEGNIRITGNTCDIGSEQHNLKLSQRRANSVREFLANSGFPADTLLAEGLGESSPKYPNTPAERHKNRRVDLEYVCYQNEYKDQVIEQGGTSRTDPKVVWKQELIPTPPLWVRQALHNVADHKQRVDTYKTTSADGAGVCTLSADDDSYTILQDSGPTSLNVLDGDNGCGQNVTITAVSTPSHGTVTISGDSHFVVYTPNAGYTGNDSFTYTITDEEGNTDTATVNIVVSSGVDNSPVTVDDTATTTTGTPVDVNVLANDSDPNGDTLTISGVGDPAHGSVVQNGDVLTYTPDAGFTGTDTFTYTVKDPDGNTSTATVSITVNGSNSPVTNSDTATTTTDTPVDIDVLANDSDPNGDDLTVTGYGDPAHGSVTQNGNILTYTPDTGFTGTDTFTYTVKDPDGNTSTGTVTVTVNAKSAPYVTNDTKSTDNATPVTIDVLANDSDPSGGTLSIHSYSQGSNGGTVELANGQLKYTPASGFVGTDSFTYTVSNGSSTATGTVTVTVTAATSGGSCPANMTASDTMTFEYSNSSPATFDIDLSKYVTTADIEKVYIVSESASSEIYSIPGELGGGSPGTLKRTGNTLTFIASAAYCETGYATFYVKLKGCNQPVAVTIKFDPY